jgi:hypothetical protein
MTVGLTYSDLKLTNLFTKKSVCASALVDTGAMHLCIPEELAVQLGFDSIEVETVQVTEAFVIGNETLLGVAPIEAMDLIVDSASRQLRVNPAHPNFAVFPVK